MIKFITRVILLAVLGGGLAGCTKTTNEPAPAPPLSATNPPAPTPKTSPELEKLVGKWERPDGGYVLEIRSVAADGKVEAAYFNPSPIHVERSRAYREAGTTKLFVELRDVNYPGCTYKLELDPKSDQLFGQYFQATMGETYEIVFMRRK